MYLHMYICMYASENTHPDLQPAHHRATHPPVWSSPATPCRQRAVAVLALATAPRIFTPLPVACS